MAITPVPTIKLNLVTERTVRFDYETLARVEATLGKNAYELLEQIAPFLPSEADMEEVPEAERQEGGRTRRVTTAGAARVQRSINVGFAGKFVAACLGLDTAQLGDIVGAGVVRTFYTLATEYVQAVGMLNAEPEETPVNPTAA